MVVAKTSRKGKKAWRRNIDTTEVEEVRAEASRLERQGLSVSSIPNEQLFFVDKAGGGTPAHRPAGRRKEKKLLRCQAIISAPQKTIPVAKPAKRKAKGPAGQLQGSYRAAAGQLQKSGEEAMVPAAAEGQLQGSFRPAAGRAPGAGKTKRVCDVWEEEEEFFGQGCFAEDSMRPPKAGPQHRPYHRMRLNPIPALEIDGSGCSYNPDPIVHEEAVAEAVAAEVRKTLERELTKRDPEHALEAAPDSNLDELALLQVDAVSEESDGESGEDGEGGAAQPSGRGGAVDRKTRAKRNRAERHKAAEQELVARRAAKKQRRDLENLKQLEAEVEAMEAERASRRMRKEVERLEKLVEKPPRLGRHKFKPAPLQVLLTEEISGSLRKLKPCSQLARDRFTALQKRGVIEPRLRVMPKQAKIVAFVPGERTERARAQQDDLDSLLRRNRKLQKLQ